MSTHELGDAKLAGLDNVVRLGPPQEDREAKGREEQQDAAGREDKDGLLKDEGKVEAAAAVAVVDDGAKGGVGGGRAHGSGRSVHDGRAMGIGDEGGERERKERGKRGKGIRPRKRLMYPLVLRMASRLLGWLVGY